VHFLPNLDSNIKLTDDELELKQLATILITLEGQNLLLVIDKA